MAEFASKGVAGSGLGLGIAGTALGLLNNGVGGLFNMANGCGNNHYIEKIATLESAVALRDANIYNDQKMLELYKYVDGELKEIRKTICETTLAQSVFNAKVETGLDVIRSQVASINNTLGKLTKIVIPNDAICPGWGDVTVSVTPATPTT